MNRIKTDGQLMAQVKKGDEKAFSELVTRHHRTLILYARRLLGCDANVKDLVQETWISIVGHADGFEESKPFRPWALRILRNHTISEFRKKGKARFDSIEGDQTGFVLQKASVSEHALRGGIPEERFLAEIDKRVVREAVDSLKDKHRLILLTWLEEDEFIEVASKELNMNANAIHQLFFRAKKSLKRAIRAIEKKGFNPK